MSGAPANRIDAMFARNREAGERAMIFYVTAGFPTADATLDAIEALDEAGADLIELGVPFSDPIADGPTIQKASQAALEAGMTVKGALALARKVRAKSEIPLLFFSALNPILRYGILAFARDAAESGADGLLIPDLPPEEAGEAIEACKKHGLKLVFLAAPTTRKERRELIARASTGFIYYISLRGVTGARRTVASDLKENIAALRAATDLPIAAGFGISTPEHAREAAEAADGVVVGSALIDLIARAGAGPRLREEVAAYARSLVEALPGGQAAAKR